jgi:hypothetical protein
MTDLNSTIREIVQHEIHQALANLSISVGTPGLVKRGPGRPRTVAAVTGAPMRRKARASVAAARGLKPAGKTAGDYEKGQKVRYMQGRGVFEAKVTAIHKDTNMVTVEGEKGAKERPADKLYLA